VALIAIIEGVRVTVYPNDHPPPHFHARIAEHEALVSIATGEVLEGSLPRPKLAAIKAWYVAHQDEIAYLWTEVQAMRPVEGSTDEILQDRSGNDPALSGCEAHL
jgi:hypothetical protein